MKPYLQTSYTNKVTYGTHYYANSKAQTSQGEGGSNTLMGTNNAPLCDYF
jgi:hypothetical protein